MSRWCRVYTVLQCETSAVLAWLASVLVQSCLAAAVYMASNSFSSHLSLHWSVHCAGVCAADNLKQVLRYGAASTCV
jgi:hypothetical protein